MRCAWVMQLGWVLFQTCHSLLVSCLIPAWKAKKPISNSPCAIHAVHPLGSTDLLVRGLPFSSPYMTAASM